MPPERSGPEVSRQIFTKSAAGYVSRFLRNIDNLLFLLEFVLIAQTWIRDVVSRLIDRL